MSMKGVRRAAVVVEFDDGERLLYEFNPGAPITVDLVLPDWAHGVALWEVNETRSIPRDLVVSGQFAGGVQWAADMPTAQPTPGQAAISAPAAQLERGNR